MLGENYLSVEISSLRDSPIVYPVRYYNITWELSLLEPLLQDQVIAQVYRYELSLGGIREKGPT